MNGGYLVDGIADVVDNVSGLAEWELELLYGPEWADVVRAERNGEDVGLTEWGIPRES